MEIQVDTKRARERLNRLLARVPKGLEATLNRGGAIHTRAMGKRFVSYGSGDPIQTRSGALRRSFSWTVAGDTLRLHASGLPYIRIQEYGGTVTPRTRRYLTIPLDAALTPAGVLKGGARLRGNQTADGHRTFIFTSKRGNKIVATLYGKKLTPLYVLKSSVRLKPRLGFVSTFREVTQPAIIRDAKAVLAGIQ